MAWLDSQGEYYEGDRANLADRGVPARPSPIHIFVDGEWVEDAVKVAEIQAEEARAAERVAALSDIPTVNEMDAATTIIGQRAILKRVARVLRSLV